MAALKSTTSKFGKLDIACNVAGIGLAARSYNFSKKTYVRTSQREPIQ
jgi:hypothetical protein